MRAQTHVNDTQQRHQWLCSASSEYVQRSLEASLKLRSVFAGTMADSVDTAVVPASGGDVRTAMAAFPRATVLVLLSSEPAMPAPPRTTHSMMANASALASLSAIFACSHNGGYFLGIQLRAFAKEWGMLPVLLFALSLEPGVSVRKILAHATSATLPGATILACRGAACEIPLRIRYVQSVLSRASRIETLVRDVRWYEERWAQPEARGAASSMLVSGTPRARGAARLPYRGVLIKSTEVVFRGGDVQAHEAQARLSRALLQRTDLLLQDTQSSIRWSILKPWIRRDKVELLAFGAYVCPEEAKSVEAMKADDGPSLREEMSAMRQRWGRGAPHWRSLRGLRFGYCHAARDLSPEMLAARTPPAEPPAMGESGVIERSQPFFCSALLAWRSPGTASLGKVGPEGVRTRAR